MKVGVALTDILTGVYSTVAILAALAHRDHAGGGQHIDMALLDCGIAALSHFAQHPEAVAVCGRRRERFPEASVYNALADREWDTPVGQALACGGDVLMRFTAVQAVGGYEASLIAGEEPDLGRRLRAAGGEIWRIDAEMTLHDAALLRFGQWWRRMRRAGHAFAEGAALHGAGPERHWVAETRRALFWGAALPVLIVLAGLLHPAGWALPPCAGGARPCPACSPCNRKAWQTARGMWWCGT